MVLENRTKYPRLGLRYTANNFPFRYSQKRFDKPYFYYQLHIFAQRIIIFCLEL
jgi:hypothetical protein